MTLEDRFHEFLMSSKKHEDIDKLDTLFKKSDGSCSSKPDYFLFDRSIMIEKKTLNQDPTNKINKYLNELALEDIYLSKIFKGTMHIEEIINSHPDSTQLRKKIMNKAYKGLRNDVMKAANTQLKESSKFIGFNHSKGLLILNELVSAFKHDSLIHEAEINFSRKREDGSPELDFTDFVLIISETENEKISKNFICTLLINDFCSAKDFLEMSISKSLLIDWSIYNNRPIKFINGK